MNDFGPSAIKDWYALGSLVAQLGFLVAAVWFARNFLRAMRAFQEQIGALLKLSISASPAERQFTNSAARNVLAEGSPYWLPPTPTQANSPANPAEVIERGPNLFAVGWQRTLYWLREPMGGGSQVSYRRRVINWLQAPAGH